jgi:hypothetical protein
MAQLVSIVFVQLLSIKRIGFVKKDILNGIVEFID